VRGAGSPQKGARCVNRIIAFQAARLQNKRNIKPGDKDARPHHDCRHPRSLDCGFPCDRAEQCADVITEMRTMKDPMSPIDYFVAIFAGMCIGIAGVAYVCS
jgi:hypothetical protein